MESNPGDWRPFRLAQPRYQLTGDSWPAPLAPGDAAPECAARVILVRAGAASRIPVWVLVAGPNTSLMVNGQRLALGLRVLRDKDEFQLAGRPPLFYAAEDLAQVIPYPEGARAVNCARCRQPIDPASPTVSCPGCGAWCHSTEEQPCWSYAPQCPVCGRATALDAGYAWTPELV
jgi:hypothetical protein